MGLRSFLCFVVSWLWEWIDGCVVVWIVLLSCSGRMLLLVSPGVLWSSPSTVALDVDVVGSSADTEETILTWVTVSADVHGGANLTVVKTTSSVDGASSVGNFVLGHPLECVVGLTTVASLVGSLTGDDDLWGDVDVWPCSLSGDFNSVRKSRGGSVGPAGAAVGWQVLVEDVSKVVLAINVVPSD